MRDYWLTQELLRAVGYGFIALSLLGVVLALWLPKGKWAKLIALGVVAFLISIPVRQGVKEYEQAKAAKAAYQARYAHAQALFAERCKTAGEKIYRTVEGVGGLLLTALRPDRISNASQYDADDQYGYNVGGEDYVRYYLIGSRDLTSQYRFIEAPTESGKIRFTMPLDAETSYRYWTKGGGELPIEAEIVDSFSARYSVEWMDISGKDDRANWIAVGLLRIKDRETDEILGERTGYLFETGMGDTAGQRAPWPWARYYAKSCPSASEHNRVFVEKVLKPIKGEGK
jgi:hypothetical protein